jgi:curved DNA-binding protein CbpA
VSLVVRQAHTGDHAGMTDQFDPYAILQVSQDADQEVLQAAYRARARRLHPDHSDDPTASAQMARLNAAWETLGDPGRRAAYDRTHVAGVILDSPLRSASPARPTATPFAPTARTGGAVPTPRAAGSSGPSWRRGPNGQGGAGPPPGNPSGTVLNFGRHIGWSLGEIVRVDPGYLEWLDKQPQGARLRDEIDRTLRARGLRLDREPARGGGRAVRRFGLSGR